MKFFYTLIFSLAIFSVAYADFSSTNFVLENPSTVIEGGQASSPSFQYFGSTGQLTNGQSTSTNFAQNAGFLYFPTATSPIISATAGDGQVSLSWTPATGIFANITSYQLGVSVSSGSGYAYTSVGSTLNTIKTPLTNSVPYFFKVRSYAAGILLSESAEVSATPIATIVTPPGGGGGGGGNVTPPTATHAVIFSGRSYPSSTVVLLKDAQVLTSTIAGSDANFTINIDNLSSGNYIFSVYSEDYQGNRSSLLTFPVSITTGSSTNIGGIYIAPTIATDKAQVKRGDNISIFGQSTPNSEITISIHSDPEIFKKTSSDKIGAYLQVVDSSELELGDHLTKSKAARDGQISSYSKAVSFTVGTKNLDADKTKKCPNKGDENNDCKVNLVDFSIATYWYKNKNPPVKVDLNGDGIVNLIDFSIMAFYWTG